MIQTHIIIKILEEHISSRFGSFPVIPGHLHGDQRRLNCIASRFKRRSSLGSEAPGMTCSMEEIIG